VPAGARRLDADGLPIGIQLHDNFVGSRCSLDRPHLMPRLAVHAARAINKRTPKGSPSRLNLGAFRRSDRVEGPINARNQKRTDRSYDHRKHQLANHNNSSKPKSMRVVKK
jgi:hypothetical protein